jgi:hypothetical protein
VHNSNLKHLTHSVCNYNLIIATENEQNEILVEFMYLNFIFIIYEWELRITCEILLSKFTRHEITYFFKYKLSATNVYYTIGIAQSV